MGDVLGTAMRVGSLGLVFPLLLRLLSSFSLASAGCTDTTRHCTEPASMGAGGSWQRKQTPIFFFNISRRAQPSDSVNYKLHTGEPYNQLCPE